MEPKTVRIGNSRLSLSTSSRKGALIGVLTLPSGKVEPFQLKASDLEQALKRLKGSRRARKETSPETT